MKFLIWLFIKCICPSLKVKFTEEEQTAYDYNEECIYINLAEDLDSFGFRRHLREVHGCEMMKEFSGWTWAILHEIGHHFTLDMCEEDETEMRAICAVIDTDKLTPEIADMYFNLESEWEATEWAIDFVKSHFGLCKCFTALTR